MEINYSELIDLGFERHDIDDQVWMDFYGYGYFFLDYKFEKDNKNFVIEWQPDTRKVQYFEILDKYGSVRYISDLDMEGIKKIIL